MSLEIACSLLKDIDASLEREERGKVTKSFLRKVAEMINEYRSKEEFLLSVAYMVARNKKHDRDDLVTFYNRLIKEIKKLDDESWKKELAQIMENVVKLYYVKAENLLEEDLICTTK